MPSIDELKPLFRAISLRNWASVEEEAGRIAVRLEEKGQHTAARALRGSLTATNGVARRFSQPEVSSIGNDVPESLELVRNPKPLADVCLRSPIRGDLDLLIQEWRHRTSLQEKGLSPRRRFLFHGPPGCGKSLCAAALGRELGLPVYVVRFDGLIASLLGQTAVNLRTLFDYCSRQPSVLLIDEIDALGRHRGQRTDVGELDRVVISLMQELEHSHSDGLVIATCNLPDDLDAAVWRRFDAHLEFPMPTKAEILRYAKEMAHQFRMPFTNELRGLLSKRMSYADAERLVEDKARRMILRKV